MTKCWGPLKMQCLTPSSGQVKAFLWASTMPHPGGRPPLPLDNGGIKPRGGPQRNLSILHRIQYALPSEASWESPAVHASHTDATEKTIATEKGWHVEQQNWELSNVSSIFEVSAKVSFGQVIGYLTYCIENWDVVQFGILHSRNICIYMRLVRRLLLWPSLPNLK